jgi:hypothetical protein
MVKFSLRSGDSPSVNWYADWTTFEESSDSFCSGLIKLLEASKDGFSSIKGAIKEKADDTYTFFDSYYSKQHLEGANNESIEDFIWFYQYSGFMGANGSQEAINKRFYEYKSKVEACVPELKEKEKDEGDDSADATSELKIEYEAIIDYITHYIRLQVTYDYSSSDYKLELVVEETY